ncbi:radial spoke head protein 3 homolog [Exaiptasia diaphana]|uniref:Radial spoke protein 3 n=1 Tax=Exaiptasia diaphana TaxID=2652724 RepID=A0A913XV93_EXADI|nr:radial spoke head protein 3 homolog [Exaiptasia diaphana]KXJ24414.1 Radial spoke head protein 3-like [Exaiptasia diaphana]
MTAVVAQKGDSRTYTFASQPRPVQQRKKFRDPLTQQNESPMPYGNIMYDKRIVRGNTYAQRTLPASSQPDPIEIQRQQEMRRRAIARKRAKEQLKPRSPEPVEGRKHIDVQTELYLEELSDRVEEAEVETQTDAFLDRPPSPLFIPAKTGVDVATQILEGELFDFDIEVKPILEVLVGKTVEQALLEVMEEEELANLRAQQRRFEELRNAELVETQRLEEQERRRREEKERRMRQQAEVLLKEKETGEKIAARAFAQSYLADLVPSVFGSLNENGYFYDPVERDVEQYFMPWLMERVGENLNKSMAARHLLDSIIKEVVAKRLQIYSKLDEEIRKAQENEAMARAAEQRQKIEEATAQESTEEPKPDDAAETPQDEGTPEEPAADKEGEPTTEPQNAAPEITETTEETQEES